MADNLNIEKVLFLDIETVPQFESYGSLNSADKELWDNKALHLKKTDFDTAESLYPRAGIYAEFGKIVCISVGWFVIENSKRNLKVKSFYSDDETNLLLKFSELLKNQFNKSSHLLCAHNGKEFDFPYLCRRMLLNKIKIPDILNIGGKKPWEVQHLDTMDMWRFGDYKSYTPLKLLTHIFNIPSPKDEIDGSDVWHVYWKDKDLKKIAKYCQKDVVAVARLILAFKNESVLNDSEIEILN
ncbi:MAG TPA: 3'-5' exonuclease [Bacteroidia bacterium]|mgnify:CR=1 FL=1|nr:3'-5' exonuclease [Bacteroidia bacterium]QQR96406.1 MAG: 3'-5' exonuclease [Bacteroidota bacterium]MBP7713529.1 3'-5' exonuclease [Bacteroidia bacterium]MBP8667371.1 3'-5' exonuclease [Bacteroidia bacterium]HOZ82881.1 3'-5' exonuclease [Bacteroidia bacterium]